MKRILVIILILMLTIVPNVSAAENNIALSEGVTSKGSTSVNLTAGDVSVKEENSDVKATSYTEINGEKFVPAVSSNVGDALVWGTGETQWFFFSDPTVSISYQYSGSQLKETIRLKEDKQLSVPINLDANSKLIPWDNGRWKIVSATSGLTMPGIIIEKPFGIDANGNYIDMDYTYTDGKLNLEYSRTITKYRTEEITIPASQVNGTAAYNTTITVPEYSAIAYPLIIDPTWTYVTGYGRYEDTTTVPGYTVVMWNQSGTNNWTPPVGITSLEWLVVAGGGSGSFDRGGGGGAGGFRNGTNVSIGTSSIPISVGAGGATETSTEGNDGSDSQFGNILSKGGGGGGTYGGSGRAGGSGGGGAFDNNAGGSKTATPIQGNDGARGSNAVPAGAGGGGGA